MSGRLKISIKKSYCPWSASNVSKYRKEEQRVRESQRLEENKLKEVASQNRRHSMAQERARKWNETLSPLNPDHVHLFPPPPDSETRGVGRHSAEHETKSTNKMKHDKPFYLVARTDFSLDQRNHTAKGSDSRKIVKERSKHDASDPMHNVCRESGEKVSSVEKQLATTRNSLSEREESCVTMPPHPPEIQECHVRAIKDDERRKRKRRERRSTRKFSRRDDDDDPGSTSSSVYSEEDQRKDQKRRRKEKRKQKKWEHERDRHKRHGERLLERNETMESNIEMLRRKRLERESKEQKRESTLMSLVSRNNPQSSYGYNSQYHRFIS